jgi:hypothetical protein
MVRRLIRFGRLNSNIDDQRSRVESDLMSQNLNLIQLALINHFITSIRPSLFHSHSLLPLCSIICTINPPSLPLSRLFKAFPTLSKLSFAGESGALTSASHVLNCSSGQFTFKSTDQTVVYLSSSGHFGQNGLGER